MGPQFAGHGRMTIPGQLAAVRITTDSGEEDGGKAAGLLAGQVVPFEAGGKPAFVPKTMWRSAPTQDGWASLQVEFPLDVPLTRVVFHTMPLDEADAAQAVRISVQGTGNGFQLVAEKDLETIDDAVAIPRTTARIWRFEFRAAPGAAVTVRGIEYFSGRDALFPPLVPFQAPNDRGVSPLERGL